MRAHKDAPDTIRALSAAVVVFSHAIQIIWLPAIGLGNATHLTNSFLSETAVIIFFVLSGYLISASIGANLARNGRFHVLDYAFSRAVRIYPPLLCAATLSTFLFGVMWVGAWPGVASKLAFSGDLYVARETVFVTLDDLINAVAMRNGLLLINGALWSLYVEVKLYAVAGLLVFCLFGTPHILLRLAVAAVLIWLAQTWSLGITAPQWVYGAWWIAGASLFLIGRLRQGAWIWGGAALAATGLVIVVLSPTRIDLEAARIVTVLLLSYAMFFRWSWSEPVSKIIAGYSYTLYLIHFPIMIFAYSLFVKLAGPDAPSMAARILVMGLGIGASFLCAGMIAALAEDTARIKNGLGAWARQARQGF